MARRSTKQPTKRRKTPTPDKVITWPVPGTAAAPGFFIPGAPRPPIGRLEDAIIWIYGAPKIGKTTFASCFPGAWFVATEPGQDWVEVREPTPIASWTDFRSWANWVEDTQPTTFADGSPIRTIIIDTVDLLFKYAFNSVCSGLNIEDPSELGHGKAWSRLEHEFGRVITKLSHWPFGLVLISHAREREYAHLGKKVIRMEPDMMKTGGRIVASAADLILYFFSETKAQLNAKRIPTGKFIEQRMMQCWPSASAVGGGRMSKYLPVTLPLDFDKLMEHLDAGKLTQPTWA